MTGAIVLLTLAYAAVGALLLNLNLATRYSIWVKVTGIIVVTALYVGSWSGFHRVMGWATLEPMPVDFRVLWITMEEPDKLTGTAGSIYFWIRTLDAAGLPVGEPRAHRVEWSEESAEAAQEAVDRMEEGERLNGRLGRNLVADREQAESGLQYAGEQSVSGTGGLRPDFEFVRAPAPALPAKAVPAETMR